jgi:hypothetical protein
MVDFENLALFLVGILAFFLAVELFITAIIINDLYFVGCGIFSVLAGICICILGYPFYRGEKR